MNRRVFLSLIGAMALAGVAQADVVLPNVPAGTQYRVVFVSTNTYQSYTGSNPAQTRSIAYWNTIATNEAAASASATITGATWHALGSVFDGSSTTNATAITGMSDTVSDGIPVYNTLGQLVAADSVAFWSLTHAAGMNGDANGNTVNANAWVGWYPTLQTFRPFGHGGSTYFGSSSNTNWNSNATLGSQNFLRIFAISEPITAAPVPTPGAAALMGLGGLAMARRRR